MSAFLVWIAIVVFVIGFFVEATCNADKHLWKSAIGWILMFGAFILALLQ